MAWIAGIVALLVATAVHGQAFPEPRVLKINDRVQVLRGPIQHANRDNQGYMINATVIVGDAGVILVDSGGSDEVGRHLAKAVRRITPKPVTHVVNTHHHGDHHLGNVAFAPAVVVSSEACRALVLETGAEWVALMERDIGRKLPGTRAVAAAVTYPLGARTEAILQGVRMVFLVPRGSHTAGDLLVYLPDDKVVIAGDVLVNGIVPTLQDGFLGNWVRTLGEVIALDAEHFVPGHGEVMTRGDVVRLRDDLAHFHAAVKEAYGRGLSEVEMRASLDFGMWEKLERPYVIGRNLNRAYLEIEADSFDRK